MYKVLTLATILYPLVASAQNIEQRCADLSTSCVCSETFNTNSSTSFTNGGTTWLNPSNSTTKPCGGWNGIPPGIGYSTESNGFSPIAVPETSMPAGNSVTYVWNSNSASGHLFASGNGSIASSTKRRCDRYYVKMSSDYITHCNAGKWWELTYDISTYRFQTGNNCGQNNCNAPSTSRDSTLDVFSWADIWAGTNHSGTSNASTDLKPYDVLGEWMRVENCVSGDFSGGTGTFKIEHVWSAITGPKAGQSFTATVSGLAGPGPGTGYPGGANAIANLFRGNDSLGCDASINPTGTREFSFEMEAEWTSDLGQFIGPAVEVEGTGGIPTAPTKLNGEINGKGQILLHLSHLLRLTGTWWM